MRLTAPAAFAVKLLCLANLLRASLFALIVIIPATAQQGDSDTTWKRFNELYDAGNYPAALVEARKVEADLKARFGVNHPNYADALSGLAMVYASQGKHEDAEALFKRALAIREKALGAGHPDVAHALNALAIVYEKQGRYGDAEAHYKRALAIDEKALDPSHPDVSQILNNLAVVYRLQGKYGDAEALYKRALALREKALGTNHPDVAQTLNNLANLYATQGRYEDAEAFFKRVLAIQQEKLGKDHPDVTRTLNNLAIVYDSQGKYRDAEVFFKRALAIKEKVLGATHFEVAQVLNNLAVVYRLQGRYGDAEALCKRALEISEKALGASHPDVSAMLNNLGIVYEMQGKYSDAEGLYKRALTIKEKALGANHPDVAKNLDNLASLYARQVKYAEAEAFFRRALAIEQEKLGKDHPDVARTLSNLAILYKAQGKNSDAEALFKRALAISEKAVGASHPGVAETLDSLAEVYYTQNRDSEAEGLYRRALAIREVVLGPNHPDVAETFSHLALLYRKIGKTDTALIYSRKASAAIVAHAAMETAGTPETERLASLIEQRGDYFTHHLMNLGAAARNNPEHTPAFSREALEIAQRASQSSTASALQQMALRFSANDGALANLVRERQDLAAFLRERDKDLVVALSKPESAASIDTLRKQISKSESRLAVVGAQLEKQFPEYVALANPKPLKVEDIQALLGTNEALLFWLATDEETHIFALTRYGFGWKTIPLGAKALEQKVAAFRHGLDVDVVLRGGPHAWFDLAVARELYVALISPVEPLIRDKQHLIVVPSAALTALPFHLLVTEKPVAAVPEVKTARDFTGYRDAAWLLKRYAVSVLPSVASLRALRVLARKEQAAKPLVGFGDPIFNPEESQPDADQKIVVATRSYPDFWKGADIDRSMLRLLPRLPETADELRAVAQKVGAPESSIHLRWNANEATVKRTMLSDYGIVYFATHGLVAGDVKGLAEPSLALTLPKEPSDLDDGLLTASEVAQLKLNADWVVLSACNTIAGEKPGAEALSGLARAFFYAGARALLVSHWAVESNAAMRLTTSTFEIMKSDPKLGRAEGLRRAMLAYMNEATDPLSAYPALWAPFVVVGEGAGR
jgi:tetratricopeptide (TPR) repeat protein